MTVIDRRYSVAEGQAVKAPCRAATTANITLSGQQTIDGVAVVAGDRVLVKNQSTGSQNGIYDVSTGPWTRSRDFDGAYDIVTGTRVYVTGGSVSVNLEYVVTTANPITIDSTSITFAGSSAQVATLVAQAAASAAAAATSETAAETAETNAETASAAAIAAVTSITSTLKDDVPAGEATTPTTNVPAMITMGGDDTGTGPLAGWYKVGSQPSHSAKFQSAGGHWYELTDNIIDVRSIATIDLTGVVNCATELQTAITTAATLYRPLFLPKGVYLLGGTRIRVPSHSRIYGAGWRNTVFKRTVDDTDGTIEVYNASDVVIQDCGILTTLSTHTLGYGQTGFCARNGSTDVTFLRCGVSGEMNRKFHCINSARVRFIDCFSPYGEGNATLRIVCDFDAEDYPEMSDENAPIQVRDILVRGCQFSGPSTDGGTDRVVSYGIDCASVLNVSDLCANIKFRDNSIAFYTSQGIAAGGRVTHVSMQGNDIRNIFTSTAGNGGTGILAAQSTNSPTFTRIVDNSCELCDQGIYSTAAIMTLIANNICYANLSNGILVSAGNDCVVSGNIADENAGKGIYVTGSSTGVVLSGNKAKANTGVGIQTDAGTTGVLLGNSSLGNGTAYTNNGTFILGNTGTPVGNQ